ncbi:tetratricopeptide repeat protein [Nonomuraea gerenzanensis]|nr:tetratricopeptide repeat protein [Nonomuraea gerenzanensis]UBU08751.1 tetratricopeptide repeat protein [Nonomuraea gerenzanensis]
MIVYEGGEPYRWALLPAPVPPTAGEGRARPSELLRAANAVIDFTGRQAVMAELKDWRDAGAPQNATVKLIHGAGGQGKTRLAGHVAGEWQRDGWAVLAAHHKRDRSTPDVFEVPDLDRAAGVLVLVDYAERWDTADLLKLLRDTILPRRLPVRVLLLARPSGTWWSSLKERMQRDLRLDPSLRELEPLEGEAGIDRGGLFTAARDRFAELLRVPGADSIEPPPALERHEAYRLVLTVHMAALAVVLASTLGQDPPGDPVQVSEFLLARERDHWEAMASPQKEKPLATSPDAMGQVVYTATLTGRLDHGDGTFALERAKIESSQAAGQLVKDHALCYPPTVTVGTVLEPLYPDRLGEDFIALSTPGHAHDFPADPWVPAVPARLLAPSAVEERGQRSDPVAPPWTRHVLTTLIETADRWQHVADRVLYPLLKHAPQLALEAGGAALTMLAGLEPADLEVLEAVESVLPKHRHVELDVAAAAVVSRLAENRLAVVEDPARRAQIYDVLAIRLSHAGLHSRAVVEGLHAVDLWLSLAERDRRTYLPELAASLANQASLLAGFGGRDHALRVSEQVLELYSELYEGDHDVYLRDLAASTHNHAVLLAEAGRRSEAMSCSARAVELRFELAKRDGHRHLPDLAASLGNHALRLLEAGHRDDAVDLCGRVVRLYDTLVESNRAAYLPDFARSLTHYAVLLTEKGRLNDVVPVSEQAVRLYEECVSFNRAAHLPYFAMALTNYATGLAGVGRRAEAGQASERAVELYDELAALNRDAYAPKLAAALTTHAMCLAETMRPVDAVHTSEQALQLYEELAEHNREAFLPDLAISLNNHAALLTEAGRQAEAVSPSERAVELRRELAEHNRDAYVPDLATSLSNHAALLAELGRQYEAFPVSEEAVELQGRLATGDRNAYLPKLATASHNHAALLAELGRYEEAVSVSEQAVELRLELVNRDQHLYLPDLAASLGNHASRLAEVSRWDEAIRTSEHNVQLFRQLAADDSDTYLPDYVQSLGVQGSVLSLAGRHDQAVRSLLEGLILSRDFPEHATHIRRFVATVFRKAYQANTAEVGAAFESLTGYSIRAWQEQRGFPG